MKAWLKFGIILALSGILIQILMFVTGTTDYSMTAFGIIMLLFILVLYFGMVETRDQELGGSMKYGKAFVIGLLISLVTGGFTTIYTAATYDFIGKTIAQEQYDDAEERMEAWGLSDEQIEESMERQKAFMGRWPMAGMGFVSNAVLGIFLSLIMAAVTSRNPKDDFIEEDPLLDEIE